MTYQIDHDFHIHSQLSLCSNDPEQNNQRILQYAEDHGLKTLCLTDHFWDEKIEGALGAFYQKQDYAHISQALPLPQSENVRFLFGCEADMERHYTVAIAKETCDKMAFVIVPTTHFHLGGMAFPFGETPTPAERAKLWVDRFDALLQKDLPFHKMGIAHLTCHLIAPTRPEFLETISLIPDEEMVRLFKQAAAVGLGIEINASDMKYSAEEADIVLRPYRVAKECSCKFYLGSDAHHPNELEDAIPLFRKGVAALDLKESDKYHIPGL